MQAGFGRVTQWLSGLKRSLEVFKSGVGPGALFSRRCAEQAHLWISDAMDPGSLYSRTCDWAGSDFLCFGSFGYRVRDVCSGLRLGIPAFETDSLFIRCPSISRRSGSSYAECRRCAAMEADLLSCTHQHQHVAASTHG